MAYTITDHFKKRFCQAGVLAGVVAAPFTGGLSLLGSLCVGIVSEKYNSTLQSEEEYLDEKIYYKKREVVYNYNEARKEELRLHHRLKSIENNVREGGIFIDD